MQMRKLASTALGAIMAGATFAVPALGATLADLPAPFVSGGAADFTIVVGSGAAPGDIIGAVDIAARFGGETVTTTGGGAGDTEEGQEDVQLGEAISNEFGTTLDDMDVGILMDTTINFDTEDWDVHDEIVFTSTGPSIETSLTSNEEDYKANPVLELVKDDIGYFYVFDEAINLSARVDSDTELEIDFLGQTLTITKITDTDTMTVRAGQELELDAGESATVEGKTVKLIQTSSNDARVEVNGVTAVINEGSTKTVNGLQVKVDTIFDDEGSANDFAVLIVGKDADKSVDDGDEYIDFCTTGGDSACDEDDPDWVWVINGLTANSKGDTTAGGGPTIGVQNDFVKDSATKKPITIGGAYWLPHDFAKVEMTRLLVDSFVKLTVEFDNSIDVDNADAAGMTWGTSEDGFTVVADIDETITLDDDAPGWSVNAISSDVSTDKLAFVVNKRITGIGANATIDVFYWDNNNKPVYAGNITGHTGAPASATTVPLGFAFVDYKDTTGASRVKISVNSSNMTADATWLVFENEDSNIADAATDSLFIRLGTGAALGIGGATNFTALGLTGDEDEAGELVYGDDVGDTGIGSRDEDQLTAYGIKVGDPEANGNADRVVLWVPGDRQEVRVTVAGSGTTTTTTTGRTGVITTSVSKLDTEVSNAAAEKNLILVGGPCINRLTAQAMGKTFPACGADSGIPANGYLIRLVENAFTTGKSALIVAGWEAADTREAAAKVQQFGLTGMEVTG